MFTIKTLNAISPVGLAKLNKNLFDVSVDADVIHRQINPSKEIISGSGLFRKNLFRPKNGFLHIYNLFFTDKTGCFGIIKYQFSAHSLILLFLREINFIHIF